MAVSHLFPYPKNPACIFDKSFKTLYFHKESHEEGPNPYFFIRKIATGRPKLIFS